MKKIFIALSLTLACAFFNTTRPNGDSNYKLIDAIDNIDLEKVEKLLKKPCNFSQEQKEAILKAISAAVKSVKFCKNSSLSLIMSKNDLFSLIFGLFCIFKIGVPFIIGGLIAAQIKIREDQLHGAELFFCLMGAGSVSAFGGVIVWLGINQARKGWNLYSAHNSLKQARKIQEIIEKHFAKSSGELQSANLIKNKAKQSIN